MPDIIGQARKSLWIETGPYGKAMHRLYGQARKSLWIETRAVEDLEKIRLWSGS